MLSNIPYKINKIEKGIDSYTNEKEVRYYTEKYYIKVRVLPVYNNYPYHDEPMSYSLSYERRPIPYA